MLRTAWRLALVPLALFSGVALLPGRAPADELAAFRNGNFLAVNTHGTARNESKSADRTVYTFDLFSLATGQKIGTATDDVACSSSNPPPCAVFDAITTFHLPDGDIVNHAQVSVVPDPQLPGWFVVASGGLDGQRTIVAEKGTGAYAGRSGTVRLRGTDDGRSYPASLTLDDLWVIQLDQ